MKYLRWATSWILYGIGHLAYLFIDRVIPESSDDDPGPIFHAGYRLWQSAMAASSDVQTDPAFGPWRPPSPQETPR